MSRLRFCVKLNPSKSEAGNLAAYGNVTFAPMDALADGLGGIDTSLEKPADELAASNYSFFAEGDLLLAKVTPCFENGKKALVSSLPNRIGFATSEVHVIRPNEKRVDPSYLRYVLCSETFRSSGIASMTGAGGLRRISDNAIKDFLLPISDLDLQCATARYLDIETSRIEQLIAKKESQVALLFEKEALLLDELTFGSPTTGKLIPIPFKWICRIPNGQVDPTEDAWADFPLVAPNHIESGTGRLLLVESAREQGADSGKYAFPANTLVYSKIRPALAKACIVPLAGLCSADMYPIIPDRRLQPQFLLMQMLSRTFTTWATTESMRVAMPKINRETLGNFRVLVPPIDEQQRAIDEWTSIRGQTESMRKAILSTIHTLKEKRAVLITEAVNGKIQHSGVDVTVAIQPDRSRFRLVVGAEIIHRHKGNPKFGRVKLQKELYLAEAYVGISELHGHYLREAAGPLDRALIEDTEKTLEAEGFYRKRQPDGAGTVVTYAPLSKAGQHTAELSRLLGPRADALRDLINLLGDLDRREVEAVTTLFAVWNDILIDGQQPDDSSILKGVLTDWHREKGEKFRQDDLKRWLGWMKRHGLTPRGQGPRTAHTMTRDMFA